MKRILSILAVPILMSVAVSSWASNIGVVDMQQIFQSSPQVKQMNDDLKKQFSDRKGQLDTMGKTLQTDMMSYEKNKSVMNKSSLQQLESKITDEQQKMQQANVQFQRDLYSAQNDKTKQFLDQVKAVVKTIAADQKLDIVLPKNSLLYSQDNLDITSKVIAELQK